MGCNGLVPVIMLSVLTLTAHAQSGAVSIRVETIDDTDRDYEKAKRTRRQASSPEVKDVIQKRHLQITLSNHTTQNLANLTVKYFLFTRGLDDKQIQLLKAGKRDVSLGPSASQVINSDEATTIYTPQHTKRVRESGMTRFDQIAGSGQKQAGYGVQVFSDQTLLAETFDPPEVKSYIGQAEFLKDKPAKGRKKRD